MRINQPVTSHEYMFSAEETLVSVTDIKGRITYCNPAFIVVSGFTQEELLGQPHNLIRHPDMPTEAFRDLWATIQAGHPWTGLVKNRRRNGDFYWVQANVTPMRDGEQITGFLSVRTLPSREQVQATDRLYAGMRAQADTGRLVHVLQHGVVMRRDLRGRLAWLAAPSTPVRMALVQLLAVAAPLFCAALGASWATSGLVAVITAAISVTVTHKLAIVPLTALVRDANHLASGDLSHIVQTGASGSVGQLQRALFQLCVNLRTVVSDVRAEVLRLDTSMREIASGNHDLSSRTEAQASSLEQTAASMEQINGTVQSSAASASQGARFAADTTATTQRGSDAVQAVKITMEGIASTSQHIEGIVQIIEGVAFQTNLLALNAAVEAARAGDAGRGFAVVAAEVRTLAARTTQAARDIKQLIAESAERVMSGTKATGEARARMDDVLQSVQRVDSALNEISIAATEQQSGIAQINSAVAHLDSITQQNAALVEQLAAAAQALQSQVRGVGDTMRLLRLVRGEASLSQIDAAALRREQHSLTAPR